MKKSFMITNKYLEIIIGFLLFNVIFITIGYAVFDDELGITGVTAMVRVQKDIRITQVSVANTSSNGTAHWEDYNVSSISSGISLPNSDSTVTFNVEITNIGNMEAAVSEITGLPNNLTYSISNYHLNDMLCDDNDSTKCKLGSVSTLEITVGYAENGYNSNNVNYTIDMNFKFSYMVDSIAKIGDTYYETLQKAINAVPTDNTETTIILLNDTSEIITIASTKNINLNLNDRTLSNNGNNPVIKNEGTLNIFGGTVTTNAATNGAINNESTGTITISGGSVIVTGGRQALYNNKGNATITGSAYLRSGATERAAVQNVKDGTMLITGGTIISTGSYALNSAGTLTIGTKDGHINTTTPLFQGVNYGINASVKFNFYDGIVKSQREAFSNIAMINDKEDGYGLIYYTETIDNQEYKTAHLGISKTVRFNANYGSVSESVRYIEENHVVGELPTPIRSGYVFDGWFTALNGGSKVNANTLITDDITFYAHWTKTTNVAQIGNTIYGTLQDAINAVPTDNTPTTITMLKDAVEAVTIETGKNITLDLNNYTINNSGSKPIIENSGTLIMFNGTLRSSAEQAAVNNNAGSFTMTSGQIIATASRQAVYILGGTVEITGTSYLKSRTYGKPANSNMERGTVQNVSGTLIITGGTIIGEKQQAVSNESTLIIGTKDGTIDATTPVLIGEVHGVRSTGTFNFYDGIIKGKTDAIDGTIDDQETNSQVISGTETINGATYITAHLE